MNNIIAIAIIMQLTLLCAPLINQAAAQDRDLDVGQLFDINRELFLDCLKYLEKSRVKHSRQSHTFSKHKQNELLQELIIPGVVSHGSQHLTKQVGKIQKSGIINKESEIALLDELIASEISQKPQQNFRVSP
jgi:hypothetical protein